MDPTARPCVLGDWWGLGGEAVETASVGLAELGVVVLVVGVGGYAVGKRTSVVPEQFRRFLLPAHEAATMLGTGLFVPHLLGVDEWGVTGLSATVLLGIGLLSGLYGRYLHRHVVHLDRGDETEPVVGLVVDVPKETLFSHWWRGQVLLATVIGISVVVHVVTAVGG